MIVCIVTKDELEANGLKWIIASRFQDLEVTILDPSMDIARLLKDQPVDFVLIDMDEQLDHFLPTGQKWLGLSSERTFQVAYRALLQKAEDVLFRPFQAEQVITHLQHVRFLLRNEQKEYDHTLRIENERYTHESFLVGNKRLHKPAFASIIGISERGEAGTQLVQALREFPFPKESLVFPFSRYVLVFHPDVEHAAPFFEQYRVFFSEWKKQSNVLLSIYLWHETEMVTLVKLYEQLKQLHEHLFYEGFDVFEFVHEPRTFSELDPFLSPVEQRQWIEMLETADLGAIKEWVENDFLTLTPPYPNPEMLRIRLTSVLAQIRRLMRARGIASGELEMRYHALFQDIIHAPLMYTIVQHLLQFVGDLVNESRHRTLGEGRFVDKVHHLMEANYWNAQWSLSDCAEALRMNRSVVSRKFKKEAGESFRVALLRVRIAEAKQLLTETDERLAVISDLCGFTHSSYFSAKFKEVVGMSPLSYRHHQ